MGAHAKLNASGSKRWLGCPGSVVLTEDIPPEEMPPSGAAAMLGTCAHGLAEHCLREGIKSSRGFKDWIIWLGPEEDAVLLEPDPEVETKSHLAAKVGADVKFMAKVDDKMMDGVDIYLDTVWGDLEEMGEGTDLFVERRFSLEWLRPGMFGTSDATLYQFLGLLRVIDYKNGFIGVEAVDSTQGRYYALGLANDVEWLFSEVEIVIVQPNSPHEEGAVRRWRITKAELEKFRDELAHGADVVDEARESYRAIQDDADWKEWQGTYMALGHHCDFCPVAATLNCPLMKRMASEECQADFADDPHELMVPVDDGSEAKAQEIARLLEWVPRIDQFCRAVEALAERRKMQGLSVPNHKLVRGKANRKYALPEDRIVAVAVEHGGLKREDCYVPGKLKSPAQLEKLDKKLKAIIAKGLTVDGVEVLPPLAYKPEGKLTLVHVSDPREEVTVDPGADFDDDLPEEGED